MALTYEKIAKLSTAYRVSLQHIVNHHTTSSIFGISEEPKQPKEIAKPETLTIISGY